MKKIILIFLATFISVSVYSQDFESGDLKKRTYFRVGYSIPSWNYYGFEDADHFKTELGAISRYGANFEVGSIFMLNGIDLGPGLRFGINVDYLSLKVQVFKLHEDVHLYNIFLGSKIGPSFTYQPTKALAFDIFAKINPVWFGGILEWQHDVGPLKGHEKYLHLMYSFGINIRVYALIIGFEYDIGSMSLLSTTDEYFPNFGENEAGNKKIPMPGCNITIGLNF